MISNQNECTRETSTVDENCLEDVKPIVADNPAHDSSTNSSVEKDDSIACASELKTINNDADDIQKLEIDHLPHDDASAASNNENKVIDELSTVIENNSAKIDEHLSSVDKKLPVDLLQAPKANDDNQCEVGNVDGDCSSEKTRISETNEDKAAANKSSEDSKLHSSSGSTNEFKTKFGDNIVLVSKNEAVKRSGEVVDQSQGKQEYVDIEVVKREATDFQEESVPMTVTTDAVKDDYVNKSGVDGDLVDSASDASEQFVDAELPEQLENEYCGIDGGYTESSSSDYHGPAVNGGDGDEFDDEVQEEDNQPDDDEIEGNPAYIPKSGRFYMHDSRNTIEEYPEQPLPRSRADGKWRHDRFDERTQQPKSQRELMSRYGYDIRRQGQDDQDEKSETGESERPTVPETRSYNNTSPDVEIRGRSTRRGQHYGGGGGRVGGGSRGRGARRPAPIGPLMPQRQQSHNQQQHDRRDVLHADSKEAPRSRRVDMNNVSHQRGGRGRIFENTPHSPRGTVSVTSRYDSNQRSPHNRSDDFSRIKANENNNHQQIRRGVSNNNYQQQTLQQRNDEQRATGGGKRYSTQRSAVNYSNPQPQVVRAAATVQQHHHHQQNWHPHAFKNPPPPVPPPNIAPAPSSVPNFHSSDIVYFDPQQQISRNPIPPRAKKRLEIVPPYQTTN